MIKKTKAKAEPPPLTYRNITYEDMTREDRHRAFIMLVLADVRQGYLPIERAADLIKLVTGP